MQKRTWYLLAFSAIVFVVAIGIQLANQSAVIVSDMVAIAVAIIFVALAREVFYKQDEPLSDERTKSIVQKASTYSWWLSYVLIAILILVEQFKIVELNVSAVLGGLFFFMIFSQMALRIYFDRKGDSESAEDRQ